MSNGKYSVPEEQHFKLKEKEMDAGFLGKIFGCGDNIPKNVAGLLALLLAFAMVGVLILNRSNAIEVISLLGPFFTLVVGILIGQKISS